MLHLIAGDDGADTKMLWVDTPVVGVRVIEDCAILTTAAAEAHQLRNVSYGRCHRPKIAKNCYMRVIETPLIWPHRGKLPR